jgi:membrane peptidoglycan carboxypeptidase
MASVSPLSPVAWLARLAVVIAAGALLLTGTVIAVAPRLWQVANAHQEDPVELPGFRELAQRSYVYDIDGNEIAIYELENSQPIELSEVPEHVIAAFLAVEDNNFWNHGGVNVRSLFRATLSNIASDAPQQGASTITMQVAKNDFLAGLERDGRYKLLQILYAMRLERDYAKDEILTRYLNTVFFGNNAYGIAAAAETYFGKTVGELTEVEAAFLAGLVRSPVGYDPITNPERSRARFVQVLARMADDGLFTDDEVEGLLEGPTAFVLPERTRSLPTRTMARTYFTETVRDLLLNRTNILGETYQERYSRLFRGGLRIYTTLDPYLQVQAESARDLLPNTLEGFDAAIVALDTSTGAVRAMVGGRGFIPGEREVNLALAPSQTGSAAKIFILAAALQAGAEADDIIDGVRGCRLPNPGNPTEPIFSIDGGVAGGVFTLREHSSRSINCAFARLSQIVGLNRVVNTTYEMASSPFLYRGQPRRERIPIEPFASYATGANELSPLDMAAGMQTIANNGVHHDPFFVRYIDDAEDRRIYTHASLGRRVLDEGVALTAVDILKDTLRSGTGRRELGAFFNQRPAAGKTGTQQANTTAYFTGATPQLTAAVVVRDPDRYTSMDNVAEFIADGIPRVQGGTYPARIWGAFMTGAHAFEPVLDWPGPPPPRRVAALLYLPGSECILQAAPVTTVAKEPDDAGVEVGGDVAGSAGLMAPVAAAPPTSVLGPSPTLPSSTSIPVDPSTTTPGEDDEDTTTTSSTVFVPRPLPSQPGTTLAPDVLDPNAPMPSVPRGTPIGPC